MSAALDTLEAQALKLTPEERTQLADHLLASLAASDVDEAWFAEVERRIAAAEAGASAFTPLDQAIDHALAARE